MDIEAQAVKGRVPPGVTDTSSLLSGAAAVSVMVIERVRHPAATASRCEAVLGFAPDVQVWKKVCTRVFWCLECSCEAVGECMDVVGCCLGG